LSGGNIRNNPYATGVPSVLEGSRREAGSAIDNHLLDLNAVDERGKPLIARLDADDDAVALGAEAMKRSC